MPQFITFLLCVFSVTTPSNYATNKDGAVTPFKMANEYGALALTAHNEKAGQYFDDLVVGDEITLLYADHNETYEVASLVKYRALSPLSPTSNFRPAGGGKKINVEQMFRLMYDTDDGRLVLQTCYDGTNGRLFVIAYPKDEQ